MIEVLKSIKTEFNRLNIPYSFDDWNIDVELPYFVGELSEIPTNDEDGKREFTFTLTGEDVDTYLNLYEITENLKKEYKQSKKITLDTGVMVMTYNRTINIPVEDERIKRTQSEFTIILWEKE